MPKSLELKLKREASKKGLKGDRARSYVYGSMHKKHKSKGVKK